MSLLYSYSIDLLTGMVTTQLFAQMQTLKALLAKTDVEFAL